MLMAVRLRRWLAAKGYAEIGLASGFDLGGWRGLWWAERKGVPQAEFFFLVPSRFLAFAFGFAFTCG